MRILLLLCILSCVYGQQTYVRPEILDTPEYNLEPLETVTSYAQIYNKDGIKAYYRWLDEDHKEAYVYLINSNKLTNAHLKLSSSHQDYGQFVPSKDRPGFVLNKDNIVKVKLTFYVLKSKTITIEDILLTDK